MAKKTTSRFSVNLHTCTAVTSIDKFAANNSTASPPRRWALTTPRGVISCDYVIHATNGYASHLLPHMSGSDGIIPVRGQVMALQADATLETLTPTSWGANQGFEYWFPRPVANPATDKPLIIIGGGREAASPQFEMYIDDDSVVEPVVGKVLRGFLSSVFPEKFEEDKEPQMEWVSVIACS